MTFILIYTLVTRKYSVSVAQALLLIYRTVWLRELTSFHAA